MLVRLSHTELSLLLFALEGGEPSVVSEENCEEVCPVASHIEQELGAHALAPDKEIARHLGNHVREALIESGMFDLLARSSGSNDGAMSEADASTLREANAKLSEWQCEVRLTEQDRGLLKEAVSRLPRSAWLSMPRTMWRLRKKLRRG